MKRLIAAIVIPILVVLTIIAVALVQNGGPKMTDLVVGNVAGSRTETVQVPIVVDSQGQEVRGVLVHLRFDPAVLINVAGLAGPTFPVGWQFNAASPNPGELNYVTFGADLAVLSGHMLTARFDIAPDAPAGIYPIIVDRVDISDDGGLFPVTVRNGRVEVLVVVANAFIGMAESIDIKDLQVNPRNGGGGPGDTIQLRMTATLTDNTQQDVSDRTVWVSSNPGVCTVDATGLVTFVSESGNCRVTGSLVL